MSSFKSRTVEKCSVASTVTVTLVSDLQCESVPSPRVKLLSDRSPKFKSVTSPPLRGDGTDVTAQYIN